MGWIPRYIKVCSHLKTKSYEPRPISLNERAPAFRTLSENRLTERILSLP